MATVQQLAFTLHVDDDTVNVVAHKVWYIKTLTSCKQFALL